MSDAIVFHHPLPIGETATAGSQVRPVRMVEAFRSLGFDVELVAGYSRERAAAAKRVARDIRAGRRFAFAYAESSNTPNALNDLDHVPRHPRLDKGFLRGLHRAGVPVGLFYRDVYWRFDVYREQVPAYQRVPALALYRADWRGYLGAVDHLFLPSERMAGALPSPWPAERLSALPPGCVPVDATRQPAPGRLRVLYVGSVTPPLYDLTPLLEAVGRTPGVELTVCCRADERGVLDGYGALGDEVRVVHESGPGLDALYAAADLAALVLAPHEYRDFAMPVKLFEAVGHGVPTIATVGTSAGDFVERSGTGLAVTPKAAGEALARLRADPREVAVLAAATQRARAEHTWPRRAEAARDALVALDRRSPPA